MFIKKITHAFCLTVSLLGVSMLMGAETSTDWTKENEDNEITPLTREEFFDKDGIKPTRTNMMSTETYNSAHYPKTKVNNLQNLSFDSNDNFIFTIPSDEKEKIIYSPIVDYFLDILPYNTAQYWLILKKDLFKKHEQNERISYDSYKYSRQELATYFKIKDNKGIFSLFLKDYACAIGVSIATMLAFSFLIACYIVNKNFTPEHIQKLSKPLAWLVGTMKNIDVTLSKNKKRAILAGILISLALVITNGSAWGINGYLINKKYTHWEERQKLVLKE